MGKLFSKKKNALEDLPWYNADDGYYHLDHILSFNAKYNVIFGERSSGKTTACLMRAVDKYVESGEQFAYIRRWDIDIRGKNPNNLFNFLSESGYIKEKTKGEYNSVVFRSGCFYLSKFNSEDRTRITAPEPFGFAFALNNMEHDKSSSYPRVKMIVFDEFLTRTTYLVDEFVLFSNVLSTIIRSRNDVTIFMLGNTINKYCPYFKEMGLKNVKKMEQGTIDLYKYGNSELTVAVEYTGEGITSNQGSDVYFAFDNPKLQMITNGGWELDIYPHCPMKYAPKDIKFKYIIEFDDEMLMAEIIKKNKCIFTFIHRKTTDIKNEDKDIIYTQRYDPRKNWRRLINKPYDKIGDLIWRQFQTESVYYQDNEVGDVIMNYLHWCKQQV